MYKNFSENNKICYKTYCKVFKSENIGFSRPSQDECEICLSYNTISKILITTLINVQNA